jgi:hypothetical protein
MSKFSPRILFSSGLLLAAFTGFYNIGIIALDDYSNEISTMIPAQLQIPVSSWIHEGVHPPYARIFLSWVTKALYGVGVTEPVWQLRLCLVLLALINFSITVGCMRRLADKTAAPVQNAVMLLAGFYFLSPLLFSRPMIESLSMPFVVASCMLAQSYWQTQRLLHLNASLAILAAGCLLRPQIGACAAAIVLLPLLKRRYLDFSAVLGVGLASVVATGFADVALGKGFHGSLIKYAEYNQHAGSWHGVMPFYTFLLFFVGLALPPALFSRYRGFRWREEYAPLFTAVLFFVLFVLVHSWFPHKEERFMIPIIPIFLVLLAPLLAYFQSTRKKWRLRYFYGVNALLLLLVVTQVPQSNAIDLVRAVDRIPSIRTLVSLEDSIVLFPAAYGMHAMEIERTAISPADLMAAQTWSCDQPVVVRVDKTQLLLNLAVPFQKVAQFPPGLIERVLVKTNPNHNVRRAQLEVWLPKNCPNPF